VSHVSVVIPTIGRPSLGAAVASAHRQEGHDVEVVVVFDTETVPVDASSISGPVRFLCTGGGRGGGAARNLGVAASTGDYLAFLDDDDEWLPGKLDHQLAAATEIEQRGGLPVVGSRVLQRRAASDVIGEAVPRQLIRQGQTPQDYLFMARKVAFGRPLFCTSTILTARVVAEQVAWKHLRRHQDWQWLIEASRIPEVEFVQVEPATAFYTVGSPQSISASPDWKASLDWADSWRGEWAQKTYADFMSAQVLRYALQARDGQGTAHVIRRLSSAGTVPSFACVMSGLLGLVPRGWAERAAFAIAGMGTSKGRV
jgi:glycosyltransferase involved in cell wall biosynthesis